MTPTIEALLKAEVYQSFVAPEWEHIGKFTVRSLRGDELDAVLADKGKGNVIAVVYLLGDAKGARVFTNEQTDLAGKLPIEMQLRIIEQGMRMVRDPATTEELEAKKKASGQAIA